eukprot:XP_001701482.1 predicted protein [Chlamydomonas reinhardtii]
MQRSHRTAIDRQRRCLLLLGALGPARFEIQRRALGSLPGLRRCLRLRLLQLCGSWLARC